MGLIRDGLGKALGAGQVQTGFNGPKMPFSNNGGSNSSSTAPEPRRLPPRPDYQTYSNANGLGPRYNDSYSQRTPSPGFNQGYGYNDEQMPSRYPTSGDPSFADLPPAYGIQKDAPYTYDSQYQDLSRQNDGRMSNAYSQPHGGQGNAYMSSGARSSRDSGFRPLALPQIEYGDGKPFLRGYSDELRRYGIQESEFIQILDSVNKAVIPNPENQIFQKAANIAGYFIPGAASIGLIAGQFAIGIGTAFGHASMIAKTLSKANLDLFIPRGLEICIGQTKDVDAEAGVGSTSRGYSSDYSPEDRVAQYGNAIAPLSVVYPSQKNVGRQDPIAMLGRGIGARDNQRKMKKADKEAQKGKKSKKQGAVEGGVKWVMVRKATPDSVAHWKQTLQQSEAALAEEQKQANAR